MKLNIGDKIFANDVEIRGALTVSGSLLGPALDGYESNAEADSRWSEINQQTQALRNAADGYGSDISDLVIEVDANWSNLNAQTQGLRDAADGYLDADSYQDAFLGNTTVISLENPVLTITPTADFDIDAATSNSFIVNLGSASGTLNIELSNFSPGMSVAIQFTQHASSAVQITYPGYVLFEDSVSPVLSTGSLALDLHVIYFSGQNYFCTVSKNFGAA